ncbi:MAG TPA: cytochrome o ubiquinol oxidase subunit IV [Cycloclasticus sp.]|jgi:cytochrome o ubiquinol oxidase operon protein cyoD|nr:cytochrome o ubiquinol oxidase subunit IV [Cycloclasticus sp.]
MSSHENTHQEVGGAPHASFREYMIGFGLSVVLTIIPFWLVMGEIIEHKGLTIFIVVIFGIAQMLVHMVYFLHLNATSEDGWNIISLTFTVLLVAIAVAGSVWVMYSLDTNMMPTMQDVMGALPQHGD